MYLLFFPDKKVMFNTTKVSETRREKWTKYQIHLERNIMRYTFPSFSTIVRRRMECFLWKSQARMRYYLGHQARPWLGWKNHAKAMNNTHTVNTLLCRTDNDKSELTISHHSIKWASRVKSVIHSDTFCSHLKAFSPPRKPGQCLAVSTINCSGTAVIWYNVLLLYRNNAPFPKMP